MPYIKTGTTKINYISDVSDRFIISSVVDSTVSYETPIPIRTKDELDIYFGKNFSERDYFDELLNSRTTLLLYRPISEDPNSTVSEYIDLSIYERQEFSILPETGNSGIVYVLDNSEEFIWYLSDWIDIKTLPQNMIHPENSSSWKNRDSLRILDITNSSFSYCYPKPFSSEIWEESINSASVYSSMSGNVDSLESDYKSFSFHLNFINVVFEDGKYISFTKGDETYLAWFGITSPSQIEFADYVKRIQLLNRTRDQILQEIRDWIIQIGYTIVGNSPDNYVIYSSIISKNTYFHNLIGYSISTDFRVNQNILAQASNGKKLLDFFSKTIGKSEENISIKIENIDYYSDKYRITIGRFDYYEIHEGNLYSTPDINGNISSISDIINRESKLVTCKTYRYSGGKLPEGSWVLKGAEIENYTREMYWKSLDMIGQTTSFEDFLLIPNLKPWRQALPSNLNYYPEFKDLLIYSEARDCQVLITNEDTGYSILNVSEFPTSPQKNIIYNKDNVYKTIIDGIFSDISTDRELTNPYGNDFLFNYTQDKNNRLVFFYKSMEVYTYPRPGYYLFVRSIIEDAYSLPQNYTLYHPPVEDPFLSETLIEVQLESRKSNYLSDSGQDYYYKRYFNHPRTGIYITSILTRFCLSKISRDFNNNRWKILGNTNYGGVINNIISQLLKEYSLYSSIYIDSLIKTDSNLSISLKVYIKELVDKDISLNITLNYFN